MGIEFHKYDDLPVSKSGAGAEDYSPLGDFNDIDGLPAFLKENMAKCNYTNPTPIQRHGIPMAIEGRDLMCSAQTGSGKTAAFLIPAINAIAKEPIDPIDPNDLRVFPRALILAPTRELAIQIHNEAVKLLHNSGMRAVALYGGASPRAHMESLVPGAQIIVATPGRMNDFLERELMSLSKCKYLVLDEADRMLDMGFEPQIRGIVEESDMDRDTRARSSLSASLLLPASWPPLP